MIEQKMSKEQRRLEEACAWQNEKKRQFTAGTLLFPLLFIVVHILVLAITGAIITTFFVLSKGVSITNQSDFYKFAAESGIQHYSSIILFLIVTPIYIVFLLWRKRKDRRCFASRGVTPTTTLAAIGIGIATLGVTQLFMGALLAIASQSEGVKQLLEHYQELMQVVAPVKDGFWLQIVAVCILVPIAEELLFRGIVMGEFMRAMPAWLAIMLQALLFGAFHLQPVQSMYTIIPGIVFGLIVYWTRSVWVGVVLHMTLNFFGSTAQMVVGAENENKLLAAVLAFIIVGIFACVYLKRRHKLLCLEDKAIIKDASNAFAQATASAQAVTTNDAGLVK